MNGFVTLEDLPEKEIFIELKPEFIEKIENLIRRNFKIKDFSEKIGISYRILSHWLNRESSIRLDAFKIIIKFLGIKLQNPLTIRGKDGSRINNSRLYFDFRTSSGVRFIAAILGDGGIKKNQGLFYSNSNIDLINGFINDSKQIFGEVEFTIRKKTKDSNVHIVSLPPICGKIVARLGLKPGSKVENNPSIPKFIFHLREKQIAEFISQIIDDEGSVSIASRHIKIGFCVIETEERSNLIDDVQKLLFNLGIESSVYQYEEYNSTRGPKRKKWQIEIHSSIRLNKLYSLLNLRHKNKKQKFKELLDSFKIICFPKKKCNEIYLSRMKVIEKKKSYFTPFDLSKETNRAIGTSRNLILKFRKLNLIKCIQPYCAGNLHASGRYKVIE
jgi:intein/homing endonuclease